MNIFENNKKFNTVKVKGKVDLKIINKLTGEIVDEYHLENTETIQAQIFAGYLPDKVGFIIEDLNNFLPGNDISYVKKILWLDNIEYKEVSSTNKIKISDTEYEYGFSYSPDIGEETLYALMVYGNPLNNHTSISINVPFTVLILPQPLTVNPDYAIVGKYTIHLDKVPYTFDTTIDTYHYENTNKLITDIELNVDYYLWYLENRTFIHPANSNAWYGVEQASIQSTGQVKIRFNSDFWNYLSNYFSYIEDENERNREIIESLKYYQIKYIAYYRYYNLHREIRYYQQQYSNIRLRFENTGDSQDLNYKYEIQVFDLTTDTYNSPIFFTLHPVLEKYLYNINDNSLMVKDISVIENNDKSLYEAELYSSSKYKLPKNFNWIDNYKVPFSIYKECIWSKYYPTNYFGNKETDKKFITIKRIDSNTSYIFKPDGSYTVLDTNYKTTNLNITDYLLTFNELQTILDNNDRNSDWFTGIYITPDDWIHINGVDEFKGIDAVKLTSGDYYLSDGTYKTLPSNDNGYIWRPITGDIINLDDNTVLDSNVVIRDMPRIFRKEFTLHNDYLIDLPSYDKSNLTKAVSWYFNPTWGYDANFDHIKIGIIPNDKFILKYTMERIIQPEFVDNISPSFVENEFATFTLGKVFPIDLLQIIDLNVYRNVPFREYLIGRQDNRLPKEMKVFEFYQERCSKAEFIEIEQKNEIIYIPEHIYGASKAGNRYWDYNWNTDLLLMPEIEKPDIVVPIYTTDYRKIKWYWTGENYEIIYIIDIDYSQLDFEIDEYLINNGLVLAYKKKNADEYRYLITWLELWDNKRLVMKTSFPDNSFQPSEFYYMFLYENPLPELKSCIFNNYTGDKRTSIGGSQGSSLVIRFTTGDVIYLNHN